MGPDPCLNLPVQTVQFKTILWYMTIYQALEIPQRDEVIGRLATLKCMAAWLLSYPMSLNDLWYWHGSA